MHSGNAYPSFDVTFEGNVPLITRAALKSIAEIHKWPEFQELERHQRYFDGNQYDDRPYNWDGSMHDASEIVGAPVYPDWHAPLNERRQPTTHQIARMIVERLTGLLFGAERFPRVKVEGDAAADDFVQGLNKAIDLPEFSKEVRDAGGAEGSCGVSYGWRDGEPVVEVHDRKDFLVFTWASVAKRIPSHVVKIWRGCAPAVDAEKGSLVNRETWLAREWLAPTYDKVTKRMTAPGAERLYEYVEDPSGRLKPKWVVTEEVEAPWCTFVVIANSRNRHKTEGRSDFAGHLGMIDDLNLVLNATTNGTAANADPTLCIDLPQGASRGEVRKGGQNTIFAKADYLEISGSSVEAGLKNTDRLRSYVHEGTHVAMLDPEKLKGVVSGETIRRLMMFTTDHCDGLRLHYGDRGLARVIEGLLKLARALLAKPPPPVQVVDDFGTPVFDEAGKPMMTSAAGYIFKIPLHVDKTIEDGNEVETSYERTPGTGGDVEFVWPPYFPDSSTDQQARLTTIGLANGGKPVASHRTSIEMAAPITGVKDVDAELEAIVEGTKEWADATAGSFGENEPDGPPGKKKKESDDE